MSQAVRLAPEAQDSIALRGFVVAFVATVLPEVVSSAAMPFRSIPPAGAPPWSAAWTAGGLAAIGLGLLVAGASIARRASATPDASGVFAGRILTLVSRCAAASVLVSAGAQLVPGWGFDPGGIAGMIVGVALSRVGWLLRILGVAEGRATEDAMESATTITDRDLTRLAMKLFGWMLVAQGVLDAASALVWAPLSSVDPDTRNRMSWLVIASLASPLMFVVAGRFVSRRALGLSVALAPTERSLSVAADSASLRAIFRLGLVVLGIGALVNALPEMAQVALAYVPSWRDMVADPLGVALTPPFAKAVLAIACIAGAPRFAARLYPEA